MALLKLMLLAICAHAVTGQAATGSNIELYECLDGRKIPAAKACDRRMMDCFDGSDELVEVCPIECEVGHFPCQKWAQCVPVEWVCDGFDDCTDGTDEHEENCQVPIETPPPPICPSSEFQCADASRCLPRRYVCDNSRDCKDGSDEEKCFDINFDLPADPVTGPPVTPTPSMPPVCSKKPYSRLCEPFWHELAAKLKKKFVRKCLKKPTKKKCKKYQALLAIRAQTDGAQGGGPVDKPRKIPRRCKKNPAHKKCRKFFPSS